MKNNQLQKIAEQVIDVEARIINWDGSITEWARDLIRLRMTIQQFLANEGQIMDINQAEFLKRLLQKINLCRENVLSRARWMRTRHNSSELEDEIYIKSGVAAGQNKNHAIDERVYHGNGKSDSMRCERMRL